MRTSLNTLSLMLATNIILSVRSDVHVRSRNIRYYEDILRLEVDDFKVPWNVTWDDYKPQIFTSVATSNQTWSDPELGTPGFTPKWNAMDGLINRISFVGEYQVVNGYPLNPMGRTGLAGRGVLGRWGPNHGVNMLVTRWRRSKSGTVVKHATTARPVLQFLAIRWHGRKKWSIPGSMVIPGEDPIIAMKRICLTYVFNTDMFKFRGIDERSVSYRIDNLQREGDLIYKGYIDDAQNTDNAWIETYMMHFHDELGDHIARLPVHPAPFRSEVRWLDLDFTNDRFIILRHFRLLQKIAKKFNAHW